MYHKCQEKNQERNRICNQLATAMRNQFFITDIIDKIQVAQYTCQEQNSKAQNKIPWISQCIQPMPSIGPTADDRHQFITHISFIHQEIRARKECSHCSSQQ